MSIKEETQDVIEKLIKAELKTYKESPIDEHQTRVYIVTTVSLGVLKFVEPCRNSQEVVTRIRHNVAEHHRLEEKSVPEEIRDEIDFPSKVRAIVMFMPATAVAVTGKQIIDAGYDLHNLPPDFRESKVYKENSFHSISIHIFSYCNTPDMKTYKIVDHNNEVLDIYLHDDEAIKVYAGNPRDSNPFIGVQQLINFRE
jgi:hypothetical protein